MKHILSVVLLAAALSLPACSSSEAQKADTSNDNTIAQSVSVPNDEEEPIEETESPVDYEKAEKEWNAEIDEWLTTSGTDMGAIEVTPEEEDYSHLNVIIHDNFQSLDDSGRSFIAEDISGDLEGLVLEIFNYDEVQVDFEYQDGSPLLDE